jgi:hypothetical protein
MTAPSKSPWQSEPTGTDEAAEHLDMSPAGILARDAAILDGIKRGIVTPSFAMACRAAVAVGMASGIVVPPAPFKALGATAQGRQFRPMATTTPPGGTQNFPNEQPDTDLTPTFLHEQN